MKLTLEASQALQTRLTDHIRQPELNPPPEGLEDRRLEIYRRLFYNNVEGFMQRGFPITHKILSQQSWHRLIREFLHEHRSSSPYFTAVTHEFVSFLQHRASRQNEAAADEPPFLLELAHYEWVEVALDLADVDLEEHPADREADLLQGRPVVSPLAWSLQYQFPVHLIGPEEQPQQAPAEPTFLIVYRNCSDQVKFMATNQLTARMLALLQEDEYTDGRSVLQQIASEMGAKDLQPVIDGGRITLEKLRELDIILGVALSNA